MQRKLHIGGVIASPGWEVFNVTPGDYVDHLGDASDLSRFADETFGTLYASHILEHFDYRDQLLAVLREWWRVLQPGGEIYISVPDMATLCHFFLARDRVDINDRFQVMRMMFGGHMDPYDYHLIGFDQDILVDYLLAAGFGEFRRVSEFGFFDDASRYRFQNQLISLNLIARKPGGA